MFGKKSKSNLPLRVRLVHGLLKALKMMGLLIGLIAAVVIVWAILAATTDVVAYGPIEVWGIVVGFLGQSGSLATIAGTILVLIFLFMIVDDEIERF